MLLMILALLNFATTKEQHTDSTNKNHSLNTNTSLCNKFEEYYCESPKDYPIRTINRIISTQPNFIIKLSKTISYDIRPKRDTKGHFKACPTTEMIIKPRVGTNAHKQQRYLVNNLTSKRGEKLIQTIRVSICDTQFGESCAGGFFYGINTICKQQFSWQKLIAYDIERKQLIMESFTFPSGCSCLIHSPTF